MPTVFKQHKCMRLLFFFKRISLSYKQIRLIEQGAFLGLCSLTKLELIGCLLRNMPPLDPVKSTLTHLTLRSNSFTDIHHDYFHGFTQLVNLDLSQNALSVLPDLNTIAQTLGIFKAASNKISSINPSMTVAMFPILYRLDFERNKIKQFDREMLSCWPDLEYLNIGYNLIETLDDMSIVTRGRPIKVCL